MQNIALVIYLKDIEQNKFFAPSLLTSILYIYSLQIHFRDNNILHDLMQM